MRQISCFEFRFESVRRIPNRLNLKPPLTGRFLFRVPIQMICIFAVVCGHTKFALESHHERKPPPARQSRWIWLYGLQIHRVGSASSRRIPKLVPESHDEPTTLRRTPETDQESELLTTEDLQAASTEMQVENRERSRNSTHMIQ